MINLLAVYTPAVKVSEKAVTHTLVLCASERQRHESCVIWLVYVFSVLVCV